MKLVNVQIIKDELERLIRDYRFHSSVEAKYRCEAYKELSEWLDNLDVVELSDGLEEAANDYAHDILHDDVFETFIAGAKWQKEQFKDK